MILFILAVSLNMKSSITKKFRKELDQLPEAIQDQVIKAYEIWQSDPYQGSL